MSWSFLEIKIMPLENYDFDLGIPVYQTNGASGADVKANLENKKEIIIKPGARLAIPTGFSLAIPSGHEIQVRPRSGLSLKSGLMILNTPGTIDSDYRGEVKVIVGNLGTDDFLIKHGDRIAQIVVCPLLRGRFVITDELDETSRNHNGFGSTGIN
jgi:dUTP pyrophosphatase